MKRWVPIASLLMSVGCGGRQPGHFARDAYYEHRFPVRGLYSAPARRQIPPGEWILLNYQFQDGLPAKPKVTGEIEYFFDTNGDGTTDWPESVKRFSVHYQHARTGAEMWMFLEPLSFQDAHLNLDVIATNHVEASSGSGTIAAVIGSGVLVSKTRDLATRVLDGRHTTFDGMPGYVITYEVANVDQLKLAPDSRWRRARVVFIRTPYRWVLRTRGKYLSDWPVLAVIGFDSDPGAFDGHLPEFARFAGNFDFLGDLELLEAHAVGLLECEELQAGRVDARIDPTGAVSQLHIQGRSSTCGRRVLDVTRFAPLGQYRLVSAQLSAGARTVAFPQPLQEILAPVVASVPTPPPEPAPAGTPDAPTGGSGTSDTSVPSENTEPAPTPSGEGGSIGVDPTVPGGDDAGGGT